MSTHAAAVSAPPRTWIVTQAEVPALLPMSECIEAMHDALTALARGEALLPLRTMLWQPDRSGLLGLMPGWLGQPAALGIKVVTVFPGNHGSALDAHQGAVLLFDTAHGSLRAVMDASAVTKIRTAAVSGLATRALAREDAGDLALIGAGVQAASHLEAMRCVRPLKRVRIWSRTKAHAQAFATAHAATAGVPIEVCATAREAVTGADFVCTTTSSKTPVLEGAWLSPGAHVNAVGACFKDARELDAEAVKRARLIVDRRESALAEAGDFLMARAEGAVTDDHIAGELGELLLGKVPGRTARDQITLFESLGLAVEDLAAAHVVVRNAESRGGATSVAFGGWRSE
ncbi:MAG TPA: ornithine cyclodeaminase family protein [Candidatus Eisenbacteria bacterium]|nr:ornithine cyclodeaminase family protein [Candidatus Eisenbacteria bacterium]